MTAIEARVRRPADHEVLIQHLRDEAGFPTMRDVLLFAAAVGYAKQRRERFDRSGEPIRLEVVTSEALADTFFTMLSAATVEADPEILRPERIGERLNIFEEFACGGLSYIQEEANTRRIPLDAVLHSLVVDALVEEDGIGPASLEDLLDAI